MASGARTAIGARHHRGMTSAGETVCLLPTTHEMQKAVCGPVLPPHTIARSIADRGDDRRLPREPPRGDAHSGGRYGGGKGYGQPDNMYGKGGYGRGDFYGGGGKGYGGPSPGYYEGGGCARRERSNHLLLRAFGVGCFCAACDPADG